MVTQRRTNSRELILDAAEAVALSRGALSLTLDAVAERAGVSKGGLLYNFHNKEALLQAMVDRLCRSFEARTLERMGVTGALEAYVSAALDEHADANVAAALLAAIANDTKLLAPMREHLSRWLPQLLPAAPSFADRAIVWLATEGLWLLELLELSPLNQKQRRQVAARLIERAQAAQNAVDKPDRRDGPKRNVSGKPRATDAKRRPGSAK
jgi:AcrR family transcriptional regulator